ncbi:alpha-mannosidase [Paenibacillus sp. PL2-23]|uniref:alpha-mannosidase n=1 Tax=Paenibacillus sp. PL2-23 TaxID=2100729 RepID=UPI0030F4F61B
MFWTEEKLQARIAELEKYRYREVMPIEAFRGCEDPEGRNGARPPSSGFEQVWKRGDRWGGRDAYLWLQADVAIPSAWTGSKVVGLFDFGKTGPGNTGGFEALLYVGGEPYQGVDSNHQEVFFPAEAAGGSLSLCFRLWSGLEGGGTPESQEHRIARADLAWLEEAADDLYYTAQAALATVKELTPNDPVQPALLAALNRAFLLLDWSKPGSEGFYESVREARSLLRDGIESIGKTHAVRVSAIGHTHIDVAWLWRLKHTREKSARSFSTVLRLMEQYPEYLFLQTQPQLYDYMKSDYPDIYAQMKERIAEGRWEAGGAMWLEADCNIPSGESLVRQLLFGTRFLEQEFGETCRYLWLPDVFGYSWALPQILKKSGIDTFMTTKISWNQYNRLPHDTFFWRGIDGTEILTHFITTPEKSDMWWYTYNGEMNAFTVKGIWDAYRDKALNQELLLAYGYGDGGGGVNRDMLEMRRRLSQMPGMPHVEPERADAYFDRLQQTVAQSDAYVHEWDGELYLEYHRGTYTSQAEVKRSNRKLELLCREAEWLGAIRSVSAGRWESYPQAELHEAWKIVLRNQFHDIIPGSSIAEVYEDCREEYTDAGRLAEAAWLQSANGLAAGGANTDEEGFTVFNGSAWIRSDLVRLEGDAAAALSAGGGVLLGENGEPLLSQKASDGSLYVYAENIPSMGYAPVYIGDERRRSEAEADASAIPFTFAPGKVLTPYYELEWNGSGQLTRICDLENGREVLKPGELGNVLQVFEDKPKNFDAWDIDIYYQEKMRTIDELISVEVTEAGQLFAAIRFEWTYLDSRITQMMVVYAHSRRIDFVTEADWRERQQLLKAAFPVAIRATEATYDIQFGNVKRPTHWNTSWDSARFETVGHQWADLSERGYGVSLLNDCKYGYDIKGHIMRLSLIKSANWPDPGADEGKHAFTYSLLPHAGDWLEGGTCREAWALNNRLRYAHGIGGGRGFSLLHVQGAHVMIDAVKQAEDGGQMVLRLHEYAGARGRVEIRSDAAIASWQECNLMEKPAGQPTAGEALSFGLAPYEIKTFLLTFHEGQQA